MTVILGNVQILRLEFYSLKAIMDLRPDKTKTSGVPSNYSFPSRVSRVSLVATFSCGLCGFQTALDQRLEG